LLRVVFGYTIGNANCITSDEQGWVFGWIGRKPTIQR